jgi:hypothetical protein
MKTSSAVLAAAILAALTLGCDSVPVDAASGVHPSGWADPTAHGATAEQDLSACTSCHGADFDGGMSGVSCNACHGSAGWREDCTFCHGAPPAGHASGACGSCHTGYTESSANGALHMNGTVDASGGHGAGWTAKDQHGYTANRNGLASCRACHGADLAGGSGGTPSCSSCHSAGWSNDCTFCHGTAGVRASPPLDREGRTARANVSVGAHERHATSSLSSAIACAACHAARDDVVTDPAHVDGGPAEVAFSGVAAGGTYTRLSATDATCATWCHGAFPNGKSAAAHWTSTTAMTCDTCHAAAPATGRHPSVFSKHSSVACAACHGTGYAGTAVTGAALPTHVNGAVEKVSGLNWQASPKSCDPACHGRKDW